MGFVRVQGAAVGDVTVLGYSAEAAMTDFLSGAQSVVDGAMPDLAAADDACLVSSEFAAFNGLAVGDEVTLANPSAEDETYTCQVAGVYTGAGSSPLNRLPGLTALDPANHLIVSYPTLAAWAERSAAAAQTTADDQGNEISTALTLQPAATYVFASADDFTAFEAGLRAAGLSEYYSLTSSDLDRYQSSVVPLQNLSQFAGSLLWIVLGVGGLVLVAVGFFNIRERQYEVGVYTAIGLPKLTVAAQFAVEALIVALAGVVVGLGVGAAAAVPVADNLLSAQVAQAEADAAQQNQNFGRGGMAAGPVVTGPAGPGRAGGWASFDGGEVDYIDKIDATIGLAVAGQLGAVGLGLAVAAALAGVIVVMRYEPLTILSNRT
jgi:putative ABC transport system permease protein